MPKYSDLKTSKYIKQNDIERPCVVTLYTYEEVNVAQDGVEPDMRFALRFRELSKPLILNSTNDQSISAIVGSNDLDDWVKAAKAGLQLVLYVDPDVKYKGQKTGGVRVRASNQPQPAAHAPVEEVDRKLGPGPSNKPFLTNLASMLIDKAVQAGKLFEPRDLTPDEKKQLCEQCLTQIGKFPDCEGDVERLYEQIDLDKIFRPQAEEPAF